MKEGIQAYLQEKINAYTQIFKEQSNRNISMLKREDLYVASYNANSNIFHVELFDKMIEIHTGAMLKGNQLEYIPFFFGTFDDCNSYCDRMEEIISFVHDEYDSMNDTTERMA